MKPLVFNNLEIRLASSSADVDAAQALRFKIFHEELGAKFSNHAKATGRDVDRYDEFCDHLLVIDLERGSRSEPCVAGTYRLLRGQIAKAAKGFYSESEFDLSVLRTYPGEIMELGRSCVDSGYRRRGAMQLLWRGIAEYLSLHEVQVMFGCGSLHGTDLKEARRALAYLHHFHSAPEYMRPRALQKHYVPMDTMELDEIDPKRAQSELPPLLKGYLRVGSYVGDGAVIDHNFNTIDVCVVAEAQNFTKSYVRHFIKEPKSQLRNRPGISTG